MATWTELLVEVSTSERLVGLLFVAVVLAASAALTWATYTLGRRWTA